MSVAFTAEKRSTVQAGVVSEIASANSGTSGFARLRATGQPRQKPTGLSVLHGFARL